MKKLATVLLLGVTLIMLVGCVGKDSSTNKADTSDKSQDKTEQTSKETSKSHTVKESDEEKDEGKTETTFETEESKTGESKVLDDPQAPKVDNTLRDEKGSETSLGRARIALYEAGIDSSSIDDETILAMWNSSKGSKEAYIQSKRVAKSCSICYIKFI